jgi:hypothetical protein
MGEVVIQKHKYNPDSHGYYWEISFVQFSLVPLTLEEYHEAASKLDKIMEYHEARRMAVDSNNQHDK